LTEDGGFDDPDRSDEDGQFSFPVTFQDFIIMLKVIASDGLCLVRVQDG